MPDKYSSEYAPKFHEAMWAQGEPTEDPDVRIWIGSLSKYVEEIFPPPPRVQAGKLSNLLQRAGCVQLEEHGGGKGGHAVWLVHAQEFDSGRKDAFFNVKKDIDQQKFNGLNNRLHALENWKKQMEPLLLEIAAERAGVAITDQIAAAYEEAAEKSIAERLGVPDNNSTQENP
jgi:hypothetical protein